MVSLASVILFFLVVPAIVAFVLGVIALRRIKRKAPRGGRGLAIAGVIIGLVVILGGTAFDVGVAYFATHTTSYDDLEPGDCVKRPNGEVVLLRRQSCSANHDRQVFATVDDPADDSAAYPGRTTLRSFAESECMFRFTALATDVPNRADLGVFFLVPNQKSWENGGNRRIVCMVGNRDGSSLTQPLPLAAR